MAEKIISENRICKYTEDGRLIFTTDALLQVFGVDKRAVAKWANQGCPKLERGWWDLKEVIKWRGLSRNEGGESSAEAKKLQAEADTRYARARQEELKLQEMMGTLIPVELVAAELNSCFAAIRQTLLLLPVDIRAEIYTLYPEYCNEVVRIADTKVRACLEELGRTDKKYRDAKNVARPTAKRGRPRKGKVQSTAQANR